MDKEPRQLVKIVKEICKENEIEVKGFSDDWILHLCANNKNMYIYGYKFPNNDAAITQICTDKSALSDVLSSHKIPHIEHYYFMSPNHMQYTGENGDWEIMSNLLNKYGSIVCKSNTGSGGRNVFKVSTQKELERAVYEIFSKTKAMCISPYKDIKSEFRVIIVNSSIEVIYEKKRATVEGNGTDNIKQLIEQNIDLNNIEVDPNINYSYIPSLHEIVEISWKHNLGQGATASIVTDISIKEELTALALSCSLLLNLEFASIDIIRDDEGLKVLEINSGIMMEKFATSSSENYVIAKKIYQKAILNYLQMDNPKYMYFVKKPRQKHFVLPILDQIAKERHVTVISDKEDGNFSIFVFKNGKRFIAKDYPFNINYAGSISLCTNKAACADFLKEMGFTVPKQKYFVKKAQIENTLKELERHLNDPENLLGFGFPMIIKPNSLSQGVGVFKISSPEDGLIAAKKIMQFKEKIFLLQEYCAGHDYRIVVLNNNVIQAYERIPFHIIGNGCDTIETLLSEKTSEFKMFGRDKIVDITDSRIFKNISSQKYTLQSILGNGVKCRLQDISNLSLGGTTEDKTESISVYYKKLAIKIAQSLNLKLCGIDLIAQDITQPNNQDYIILEVNSAPGLDNYIYEGKERDDYVKKLYEKVFEFLEQL